MHVVRGAVPGRGPLRAVRGAFVSPAPGQDAVGARGPLPPQASGPPHPPPLAAHPDRLPRRRPLRPHASHGLVRGERREERRRLHLRLAGNRALHALTYEVADDLKVPRAEAGADRMRSFAAFAYASRTRSRERRVVARLEASTIAGALQRSGMALGSGACACPCGRDRDLLDREAGPNIGPNGLVGMGRRIRCRVECVTPTDFRAEKGTAPSVIGREK